MDWSFGAAVQIRTFYNLWKYFTEGQPEQYIIYLAICLLTKYTDTRIVTL